MNYQFSTTPIPVAVQPPPRKRKRTEDNNDAATFINLSRDDLLKFSSKEYEDYVKELSKKNPLSTLELKEVKRQRRLIKNREYAQTSRNKKKELVGVMESKLDQLSKENERLSFENVQLQNHVQMLNHQVSELQQVNKCLYEENHKLMSLNLCESSPRSPSSVDESSSTEVDQFLNNPSSSDSEETSCPSLPPEDSLFPFSEETIFGEESLLNDTPFSNLNWTESRGFANTVALFAVFLCFALFVPFPTNTSKAFPNQVEPTYIQPSVSNDKTSNIKSNNNPRTGRALLAVDGVQEAKDPLHFEFYSLPTCPTAPLSMEDVFLDEMSKYSTPNNVIQHNYTNLERNITNSLYDKTDLFVTISIPSLRGLVVE